MSNSANASHSNVKDGYPTEAETNLWIALNKTQRVLRGEIDRALRARNLPSLNWYDVLWGLEMAGGSLRPFELETMAIHDQSNLSHLARRMAAEGLIDIEVCDKDRRGRTLALTDRGRQIRADMWEIYGPMLHDRMQPFAEIKETSALVAALISAGWPSQEG